MPNNRHLVNELDLIRPAQLLDKGLPLPFLSGKYVVDEGWCAVISEGGAFKEVLGPGTYFLDRYKFFRDVKATALDTRVKNLLVSTTREFTISQPVPVEINLDLSTEYQVVDARRVAMEFSQPLTSLYDRVIQSVRSAVVFATVDEIRTQGEGIARATLQRLQAMQLPKVLGIEIFNVLVTTIKATDAGSDMLAQQQMKEFATVRDWQLDSMIVQNSKVTPEWLMMHRPEIYTQLMAGNQALLKEMIDKGLLDPAGFLNQTANTSPNDPMRLLSSFGFPGMGAPTLGQGMNPNQAQLSPTTNGSGNDIHARMREEIGYLEKQLSGAKVQAKPGADDSGIPDGSYDVKLEMPRSSGGKIVLYVICPVGYPQKPPVLEVVVDDQTAPFQSAVLRRWTGQYLIEIARELKQYFG